MAREDFELRAAKRSYKEASSVGSRKEEARWANVIGHILKNRGEYVEALKWLRIDYEISLKFLPEKDLLPTCQSLGELYLRLHQFKDALIYQKKHLELATDSQDLVEQQRATTQLGRTYHEIFLKSEDDHYAIRNAKKYFRSAMKLARLLKENKSSNFLKEFIDAHNNIGMLEIDLDNLEEAEKILVQGLKICDEEEVIEDDDGRSRLHHNLGYVYMVMRQWDKAREHIERDIIICKRIGHRQGESKGYINLGELHSRVQKYEEALLCYQKALDIAKSMEDEDALVEQIDQNIETVKEAAKVMDGLKNEEQNLKKLIRTTATSKGTPHERKCLLQQNAALDCLIEKANMISAWTRHLEFAKRKKYVASELCDKEKLSDSFLAIGESYQKLRNFTKALKWYKKSWSTYKTIGNLEGQALAKINIGDVLDSDGDWTGALEAFEEGYRIAVEANLPSVQISALENMHYSHMIRFQNVDEARRLQNLIQNLKCSRNTELDGKNLVKECCSETDTDEDGDLSHNCSSSLNSSKIRESASARARVSTALDEFKDDVPLISILESTKKSSKLTASHVEKQRKTSKPIEECPKGYSKSDDNQFTFSGRKRVRVVLSDDESYENDEAGISRWTHEGAFDDVTASHKFRKSDGSTCSSHKFQSASCFASKDVLSVCMPINLEESTCSYKSGGSKVAAENGTDVRFRSTDGVPNDSNFPASGSKSEEDHVSDNLPQNDNFANFNKHASDDEHHHLSFKIEDKKIQVDARTCMVDGYLDIEYLKIEVACLYYIQLSEEKSRGLLPVIQHLKWGNEALESIEAVKNLKHNSWGSNWIEVEIEGWVQKRLLKSYVDCCKECNEVPNMKLVKKLYRLEVSEDELILSDCGLQDISMTPLLDALFQHKAIAVLDLSHNFLGNETMEKLRQIFMSSSQKYGGLTLDFHCNQLGPTSLFQICECPVLLARLEVLNVSGNRLTDACGSYLSTILENCKALYSLNIEHCSISSRTVQKVADAISSGSVLTQLCLGHNPISGNALVNLLAKLGTLKRFAELNLNGIKLSKPVIDGLCMLAKSSWLSGLMLGSTSMGADGALTLVKALSMGAQELAKFDLSFCGLTCHNFVTLFTDLASAGGIVELNLGGNSIGPEGLNALVSQLENAQCSLKILVLNKCNLGLVGMAKVICALEENKPLEELNLSENANVDHDITPHDESTEEKSSKFLQPNLNSSDINPSKCASEKEHNTLQGVCTINFECNELEVADSEDDQIKCDRVASSLDYSCTSSCKRDTSTAYPKSQLIEDLATAIGKAKNLKTLDLSKNGFSNEVAEYLYMAWSSRLGSACLAQKHIKVQLVHFSVQGKSCCGTKFCCKRD